jgi:hypothetical protein
MQIQDTITNAKNKIKIQRHAKSRMAKWHNIVDKGYRQVFVMVKERTRQILSPQRRSPLGI